MTRNAIPSRQIVTIVMFIAALVAVIVMKGRCGNAIEGMFRAIDKAPEATASDGGTQRR